MKQLSSHGPSKKDLAAMAVPTFDSYYPSLVAVVVVVVIFSLSLSLWVYLDFNIFIGSMLTNLVCDSFFELRPQQLNHSNHNKDLISPKTILCAKLTLRFRYKSCGVKTTKQRLEIFAYALRWSFVIYVISIQFPRNCFQITLEKDHKITKSRWKQASLLF